MRKRIGLCQAVPQHLPTIDTANTSIVATRTGSHDRRTPSVLLFLIFAAVITMRPCAASVDATTAGVLQLHDGWAMQSSNKVAESGEILSSKAFQPQGWYKMTIPSTVLAAQVAAGEFPDPYFGMNLRKIPGTTYPIGHLFSNLPMDKNSPYAVSWWYRTEFQLPREYAGRSIWLHFQGINYRANIWLNGRKVAAARDVAGAYRIYEFSVSSFALPGEVNVLAVETFAPTEKELGINWVDWNPAPPDKNMGLWGDVYLSTSGPVSVRHPQVVTHFPDSSLQQADLTVMAQLHNPTEKPVQGVLEALVSRRRIRQDVTLQPKETRSISFGPEQFAELRVKQPKLWWPAEMGMPNLHDLTVRFSSNGQLSDEQQARFGIREVTSELTDKGYRLFRINGKKILIRGAAWAQDMLLRRSPERLEAQIQYVLDMNLNTIRLEAQLESDDFFDLADEKGILIMAGWCCCDIWERWKKWQPGTLEIATESLRTQALRMRRHPSLLMWLNGSDGPPPPEVERAYLQVLNETAWPNPVISSAADERTPVTGPSGVKMTGPYDYEPPSYWLVDKAKYGGAYGFNTETSPGPAIPPLESLRKMLPQDHLWPIDEFWNFHSAGERFKNLNRYNQAMDHSYGRPTGLEDYLKKSQAMAYDGERAMFEAYGRNKYTSTGVIQWMLNNAWPSIYWHLYDYFLYPAGGYFGTKKACEPLHVQYSYDDRSIVVVNSRQEPSSGLAVTARAYDFSLKEIFSKETKVDLDADTSKQVLTIPPFPVEPAATVYFVKLALRDQDGKELSSNFYWLPAKLSKLDWDKTPDTAFTPIATFEDMTALNHLPRFRLEATAKIEKSMNGARTCVILHNPSQNLAFQVHVGILKANSEEEILPVLWEDNYLELMPGESRELTARYLKTDAVGKDATLKVGGWNIEPVTVSLAAATAKEK
jgi:exo-1,4-beta-D-glucosaminidase